jgi:hypothetical protein
MAKDRRIGKMAWQNDVLGVTKSVVNKVKIRWKMNLVMPSATACLLSRGVSVAV